MIIIMLGAPGAGKGTIGKKISEKLQVKYLAIGDIFRALAKEETESGRKIKEWINKGELVPDELAMKTFEEEILKYDLNKGVILDGYPRTKSQAKHLDKVLEEINKKVDIAINIDISEELIVDRIVNRRICPKCKAIYNLKYGHKPTKEGICDNCGTELIQRTDDNEKTVYDRLNTYTKSTKPLLKYFDEKGVLYNLHSDENTSIEELVNTAMEELKK